MAIDTMLLEHIACLRDKRVSPWLRPGRGRGRQRKDYDECYQDLFHGVSPRPMESHGVFYPSISTSENQHKCRTTSARQFSKIIESIDWGIGGLRSHHSLGDVKTRLGDSQMRT